MTGQTILTAGRIRHAPRDCDPAQAGGSGHEGPASLSSWLDAVAAAVPQRVAVEDEDGALTYRELAQRIDRMAGRLVCLRGDVVAVALPPGRDLVVVLLAILKAGKAYVPIDPMSPPARVRLIVEQFDDLPLVTTGDLLADVAVAQRIDAASLSPTQPSPTQPSPTQPAAAGLPEDDPLRLAYVMFTSGSTGQPKGVQVTHGNVMSFIRATEEFHSWEADDASCLFHSYAFDFSVWEIFGALLHGARLVVPSWRTTRSPADFLAFVRDRRVTVLSQTPTAFSQLLRVLTPDDARRLALRQLILGGEALRFCLLRRWFALMEERVQVFNIYGPTETTVWVTCHRVCPEDAAGESDSVLGLPLPTTTVRVVDEGGRTVPDGETGEIVVGGPTVSRGYVAQPELTGQRFVTDRATGQRMYRTGDLALRRADGRLVYQGRRDAQVKIRGHRVELGEIENALSHLDEVEDCVVRLDRLDGSDGDRPRLVAYVVGAGELDVVELRRRLTSLIPRYMLPDVLVRLAALPLTINGKLDVGALPPPPRAAAAGGVPKDDDRTISGQICRIWEQVLGVTGIGETDNLFDVGGTSMHVVDVHALLVRTFDVPNLTVVDLFEYPSPEAMAARIEACRKLPCPRDAWEATDSCGQPRTTWALTAS